MNQAERHPPRLLPDVSCDISGPDDKMSIDTLTIGHGPTATTHLWQRSWMALATVLVSIAAIAMLGAQDDRELGVLASPLTPLNILVLGDTSGGTGECVGCLSYVDQFAAAESEDGRRRIRIDDKTASAQEEPASMPALVDGLRSTSHLRAAVAKADVILLAVGSGDVTHPAALCPRTWRTTCPKPIPQFRQSLTEWIAATTTIRDHRPVNLRIITPPPTSGSPRHNDIARITCEVAAAHDAECVNVYNLARTDEHIVGARADPSHPQLTQHGHDLIATQLIAIGIGNCTGLARGDFPSNGVFGPTR
jgi:hypothetical protein